MVVVLYSGGMVLYSSGMVLYGSGMVLYGSGGVVIIVSILPTATLSFRAVKHCKYLSQKSPNKGLSIFRNASFEPASTLTYNCVTGLNDLRKRHM